MESYIVPTCKQEASPKGNQGAKQTPALLVSHILNVPKGTPESTHFYFHFVTIITFKFLRN